MALTAAERQANAKAKKQEIMESLVNSNALLLAETQKLQGQLKSSEEKIKELTDKIHKMELSALRAQIKKSAVS
jgi:hypothetical protein